MRNSANWDRTVKNDFFVKSYLMQALLHEKKKGLSKTMQPPLLDTGSKHTPGLIYKGLIYKGQYSSLSGEWRHRYYIRKSSTQNPV